MGGTRFLFGGRVTVIGERLTAIVGGSTVIFLQLTVLGGTLHVFGERLTAIGERLTEMVTEL